MLHIADERMGVERNLNVRVTYAADAHGNRE